MGKGEIARYEQFLLFPQCFQKACSQGRKKVLLCGNGLNHSHTMTLFDGSRKKSPFQTLWEKEKLLVQAIPPFSTMFSPLSKTEFIIFVTFDLSSANAFNLVWSKILWK